MRDIKGGGLFVDTSFHSLKYNSKWKREEALVYLSRNEMETIIMQDPGMCLLVYRHPGQADVGQNI